MKTSGIAGTAILALLVAGIASIAFAQQASAQQTSTSQHVLQGKALGEKLQAKQLSIANNGLGDPDRYHRRINLTLGQTVTLSGLIGRFVNADNRSIRGNASGSFTFTVTGVFKAGYTLSITSGAFKIGDTTYTVTGGSVELGPYGRWMTGSGAAGQGVNFLIHAGFHGTDTATPHARVLLDVQNGSTEYLVMLRTAPS